jgi:hypothetical protein
VGPFLQGFLLGLSATCALSWFLFLMFSWRYFRDLEEMDEEAEEIEKRIEQLEKYFD